VSPTPPKKPDSKHAHPEIEGVEVDPFHCADHGVGSWLIIPGGRTD
jgi:hypothetical protein